MKATRSEQEFRDGFKDLTGQIWSAAPGSFRMFCKCVRWADDHPSKSVESWMDEVTLLHKEIRKLKEQLKNKNNEKTN